MNQFQQLSQPQAGEVDVNFSTILAGIQRPRYTFDPTNPEHRKAYKTFMETGRWPMLFRFEFPSVTVPRTCERKLLEYFLKDD